MTNLSDQKLNKKNRKKINPGFGEKKCSVCGEIRPIEEFHRDNSRLDGHRNECKPCKSDRDHRYYCGNRLKSLETSRRYKTKNRDRVLKKQRQYKKDNYESIMLSTIKKRAKTLGIESNLDISDINIPDKCPLLGIPLVPSGMKNNRDSSPSVDRKNPDKGYVKGNIAIISYRANRIKNNAKPYELKKIAKRIDDYMSC